MWNTSEIMTLLSESKLWPMSSETQLSLGKFDPEQRIGIGRDGLGNVVLVLPGQSDVLAFATESASFEPWTQVHWVEGNKDLEEVASLRCKLDNQSPELLSAVAAVFVGIIDLQIRFGTCGDAIWEMKDLFESRFERQIEDATLIGLIGELLIISTAEDTSNAVAIWHSKNEAAFDFSIDSVRIEVKTTTGSVREHHFSSNQIAPDSNFEVYVASILLKRVEVGVTLNDLHQEILDSIDNESGLKFNNLVLKILGTTPGSVTSLQFDKASSIASIEFFSGEHIPQPTSAAGVLSMNWKSSLATCAPQGISFDRLIAREAR